MRGPAAGRAGNALESAAQEGDSPVARPRPAYAGPRESRVVWDCSTKPGGKFHLKLNTDERPIANKYREGKMKRTTCSGVKRA